MTYGSCAKTAAYLCANELQIGLTVPVPEIALFRHKIPAPAFHETIILSKRWTAPAAVQAGFVEVRGTARGPAVRQR